MKKYAQNLVVVSDRKLQNGIDDALEQFSEHFAEYRFLYQGADFTLPWTQRLARWNILATKPTCDVLYFRADWFDPLMRTRRIFELVDWLRPQRFVFGLHCHLCATDDIERELMERADALVLLNEASRDYFFRKYPQIQGKPVHLLRSLFLPARSWYGSSSARPRGDDCLPLLVVGGGVNRLSALPPKRDTMVPDLSNAMNRYDYLRILRVIAGGDNVRIRIFGSFEYTAFSARDRIEALYRELGTRTELLGACPAPRYDALVGECDLGLMSGYMPYEGVPHFEHMNYQLRYNSFIKARVVPLLSVGTCAWHEEEARASRFGIVAEEMRDLRCLPDLFRQARAAYNDELHAAVIRANSFDTHREALSRFLVGDN